MGQAAVPKDVYFKHKKSVKENLGKKNKSPIILASYTCRTSPRYLSAGQLRSLPGTESHSSPGAAVPGPLLTGLECPDKLQNLLGQTLPHPAPPPPAA